MDGDLAIGKVRPARVPRGGTIYARNSPQAPRIGRHLTPPCTDGKTETQRETTMTKIVSLFRAAAGLYSGPPCLPEKGVCVGGGRILTGWECKRGLASSAFHTHGAAV